MLSNLVQLINARLARMGSNAQLRLIRADNLPNGAAALSHLDMRDPWIKIPSDRVLKQMPEEVRRKVLALILHELLHMLETLCSPDEMKQVMALESAIGAETGTSADAVHTLHNVFEDGRIERTSYSWRPGFELDFHDWVLWINLSPSSAVLQSSSSPPIATNISRRNGLIACHLSVCLPPHCMAQALVTSE